MPPPPTRPLGPLAEACEPALALLRSPELTALWTAPSALEEWSNAGLAGHLARSAFNLERALGAPRDPSSGAMDAVAYRAGCGPEPAESARNPESALGVRRDPGGGPMDTVAYYAAPGPEPAESAIGRRIRELGDEEAAEGGAALADRFARSTEALQQLADSTPRDLYVTMFGRVLPVDECATACLLELVVHCDDLTVSLGCPPRSSTNRSSSW